MHERGAASVMAMWVLLAACALSYASIATARRRTAAAQARLAFVRLPAMIRAAAVEAARQDFRDDEQVFQFANGQVKTRREHVVGGMRLHCVATADAHRETVEVRFERTPGGWRASAWIEL